ncbi:hypothetical protein IGI04_042735 [Brassica rapa subsp. trilocularis]|uniref:Uncharacterized protein n=1 Tax=Brassica rapa subsp. trilocularis TaxID=1813537 RepID=A0ABQ7KK78_BRACM|nr:hypothetical protein IGI04_042735 [Brassica rapa subsp. trilocularis]
MSVGVRQHTEDVCGFPWLSVSTHKTSVAVRVCPCVSVSTHMTSVAVHQYTYQHAGPWTQHAGPSRGMFGTSVAVHQYTYQHVGPWTQHADPSRGYTHISTLVLGLSTLALPVDCLGDFGPRAQSFQYTQDVRGCPPAHTGRLLLSVAVRQHTQDVRGCPCMSVCVRVCPCGFVSTHRTSVCVHQHKQDVCDCLSAHTGHSWLSTSTHISTLVLGLSTMTLPVDCLGDFGPHGLPVQYTQDVRGCPQHTHDVRGCLSAHTGRPWLSVAVRVCPLAHIGRLWLSISTHISTLVLGLSTLALPVDCSGDFGPRRLSVQYTQDVRGTHTTFVCVRQHTEDVRVCPSAHTGRPCVSVCVRQHTQDVRGCPSVHISARWTSVCVRQRTHRTFVAVRVCPCVSVSTDMTSMALGLNMLTLPVVCSGDFGPRGLSVQFTHNVCGCPPAHTGRPWLSVCSCVSVCVRQHTQDVCGCPCVRVCPSVSVSTHRTSVAVPQYTYQHIGPWTQHADPIPWAVWSVHTGRQWVSVSTHRTSVCVCQHTQDVPGCSCVSISTHRTSMAVHQYTYQHVGPWTQHADPSRGLFGRFWPPWAVWSVHTGRLWVSTSTHRTSVAVRVCPSVAVSTHMTSVAVHQYTHQHVGPRTQHAGPSHGLFGTHMMYVAVRVCLWVSASTHRTFVALSGCPTHRKFVAVHQYTYHPAGPCTQHAGPSCDRTSVAVPVCPSAHIGRSWLMSVGVRQHTHDVCVCPSVSVSVRLCPSVAVPQYTYQLVGPWTLHTGIPVDCLGDFVPSGLCVQYTQDVHGCPPSHTGRPGLFVAVRQHTQDIRLCPCVSVSTHMTFAGVGQHTQDARVCPTLVLGLCTLALPVDCLGDFGPRRLSVQYTQDVRGCPPAHTGRPWQSVCVRVGHSWLSTSTHISTLVLGLSTMTLPVDCLGDFGPHGLPVQYTQDVRGCPQHTHDVRGCLSAHTGRPWLSVAVRVCPLAHIGRLWLSISTHISTLVLGLSTLALPVDCSGDFGPRRLSVQYTQDVRGTHTTFVCVRQHTEDVRVCPSAHTGRPSVSVCVRQHTQDVRGCPSVHISARWTSVCVRQRTHRTFVAVRVCPCVSVSTDMTSMALGLNMLTLPVVCSGDFGPRGLSVQFTHNVCGCPPAHTGRPWLSVCSCVSVCVRQHTQDVCGCPCVRVCPSVSVSTHRTSLAVPQYTYQHIGPWTQHADPIPWAVWSVHTGRQWVSVSTHRTSVCVCQHTQDVPGCSCVSISTHRTSMAVHQYTYQHVGPWTQHADPSRGLFGRFWPPWAVWSVHTGRLWVSTSTHRTSVAVRVCPSVAVSTHMTSVAVHQYTHQHVGPRTQHAGPSHGLFGTHMMYVAVRVCLWVSASTHRTFVALCGCPTHRKFVAVHQYTYHPAGPCTQHAGPSCDRTSVAVPVCPSAHIGRSWLMSVGVRQHTHDVCVCPSVSVSVRLCPSVAVPQYTYQLVGPWTLHTGIPVDCLGDFVPSGLCVQYTQDVHGCPPSHTGRPGLFVAVRQHTQDIRLCPCVSVSTHRTFAGVGQHTQDARVCPTLVLGLCTLALPVDCLGDFGPRRLSVQYTQDVRGCPPAHTGRPWQSVCVRVCPSAQTGRTWLSISTHISTLVLGLSTLVLGLSTLDVCGCPSADTGRPCVSVSTHRTFVAYTQDVHGCPPAHTGRLWLSVCVRQHTQDIRGCPSAHTGHPWLSVCVRVCPLAHTLAHPVDCLGDFGPRGQSVQYTKDVRGCLLAHTGRRWLSVAVRQHTQDIRGCLCVPVCVRHDAQDVCACHSAHTGRPSVHISARWSLDSARWPFLWIVWVILVHVGCLFSTHSTSVGARQHTQDVRGSHTERLCVSINTHKTSVAVRVCPSEHTGHPWLSISTHISTLVLGLSTLTVTPPILNRIVGTAMVRGNMQASLRTSRQAFHGRERSSASSMKLGSVHTSSVPTKSAPLAGLLAHSVEAAESQLISARLTVRALGRWPWAKSRRPGAWVGLVTDPKPNQKGRRDASGRKGATLGRWCPFASKSVKYSEKTVERKKERKREFRPRERPIVVVLCSGDSDRLRTNSGEEREIKTRRRAWRTQTWFSRYVMGRNSIRPNGRSMRPHRGSARFLSPIRLSLSISIRFSSLLSG